MCKLLFTTLKFKHDYFKIKCHSLMLPFQLVKWCSVFYMRASVGEHTTADIRLSCDCWFVMSSTDLDAGRPLKSWRSEFTPSLFHFDTQWLGAEISRNGNVCLCSWFKEEITLVLNLSLVKARTITLIKRCDGGVYIYIGTRISQYISQ